MLGSGDRSAAAPKPFPLFVRRVYFEQFAAGTKTVEYRRHRGRFTARTFWPGREISLRYRYDKTSPRLEARVARFEVAPLAALDGAVAERLRSIYRELVDDDEIALIHLEITPTEAP